MCACVFVLNARPHFLTWEAEIFNRTSLGQGAGHCGVFKIRRGHRRSLEAVLEVVMPVSGRRWQQIEKFHKMKVVGNGRFSGTGSKKIKDRMKIERDRTGSSTATSGPSRAPMGHPIELKIGLQASFSST